MDLALEVKDDGSVCLDGQNLQVWHPSPYDVVGGTLQSGGVDRGARYSRQIQCFKY